MEVEGSSRPSTNAQASSSEGKDLTAGWRQQSKERYGKHGEVLRTYCPLETRDLPLAFGPVGIYAGYFAEAHGVVLFLGAGHLPFSRGWLACRDCSG